MRVEPIALADLGESELGEWRELAAAAIEPNPFFEPEYVLPLARGLGQEGEVQLLVAREGSGWRACLPVHRVKRWHRIPFGALATWRGHVLYGVLGTPLLAPDDPAGALGALLDWAAAAPGSVFTGLEWVAGDGPVGEALAATIADRSPAPIEFERFERAALWRRPEPTYLEETLSSKRRRELRRQRRKLGEAVGAEPETVDRAGEAAAYEAFIELEAAGAKGASGTVLAADPGHREFFTQMCAEFAREGRLQFLELRGGGQTLAMKCNLFAGNAIFCFKIAYEEKWASLSPGIQLELDMLKLFHEESEARFIDSCADANNSMINRLWPDRRTLVTQVLPGSGPRGRVARPALLAAHALRERSQKRRAR
jgi:CelD/BcsL family acetyltransferase involved in cellulose biosynthesis